MVMSRYEIARQKKQNIKIGNGSSENVVNLTYLETIVTNQNFIDEEVKSVLNSGNAYCHLVHNLLSYRLLPKILRITSKILKTLILLVSM
jgi:hypothetical protein